MFEHEDVRLAALYLSKVDNAKRRGIAFNLSFMGFKNLRKAKRCQVTGITLTTPRGNGASLRSTDLTIDRKDASQGYTKGNTVAVAHTVNNFKSNFENDTYALTTRQARKVLDFIDDSVREANA